MNERITSTTMALQPYAHPLYQTKIWDERGIFYSSLTCMQLLQEACLRTGSSYQGKRDAVKALLHLKHAIPIPISYAKGICAIPSTSPQKWECVWYFYAHVRKVQRHHDQTYVLFRNGEKLLVNASTYRTKQQLLKAAHILSHFNLTAEI
ncbi:MAG: competence protein ComK [Ectobacillus sp.]